MLRKLLIVLAILTFSVSCSNLDNKNDQEQLVCGEAPGSYHALVHIDATEDFDAILVKGGEVKRAVKTEKSCIAIAAEDRKYRLLVRDAASKSRTLQLDPDDIRPGLSSYFLTEDREGNRFQMRARCPAEEIQVSKDLEFFFKRSESDQVSYPMVRINILNSQNAKVLQTTRVLGDDVPSLPLDLPDGRYKLEMENFDAFDAQPADAGIPESCLLVIDRHKPEVDLKVERLKGFEDGSDTFTIAPASKLEFTVGQEEGGDVSICLKKRQDEAVQSDVCELTEFTNVGSSYNAPGGGAWDLYAYARDKAGNQSGLKRFKLNIYHDTVISEIHALSRTISLMVKDNLEYEAFKSLKKLIGAAKKLELKSELRDVYWQLLAHFHWAATRNSLIWEQQFDEVEGFDRDSANHSLYGEEWAVGGYVKYETTGVSYQFKGGELTKIPVRYEEFQFLPDSSMVGIRRDSATNGMVLEIFKDDVIIDHRLFDRFYEDVFIDQNLKLFVLVDSSQLLLVNMENLDEQRAIRLPEEASPYPHTGLELSTSPDSTYYYITVAAVFLRVHVATGYVQVYQDSQCWIEKAVVAPNGDVYYTGYAEDTLYARKYCQRAYKMNWDEATPSASPVLSMDEDYDSLTIVNINDKPFLVALRSNYLDVFDFGAQTQYSVYIDEFATSGKLSRHLVRTDVFYLQTADTIYKLTLRDPSPWERDQPFHLAKVPISIKGKYVKFFPTMDPGTIFIVYERKLQIRTFQPEKLDLLPVASYGSFCKVNDDGSHSICLQNKDKLVWKAHLEGTVKQHQIDFELATWELLTDGHAIILSKSNELYIWKPKADKPEKHGVLELKGKLAIGWYPRAELITISHYFDRGVLSTNRLTEKNPKTIFLTKQKGEWAISDNALDGLPLAHAILPVVLVGRVVEEKLFLDVVNSLGSVVNSLAVYSAEVVNPSQNFSAKFRRFDKYSLVLKDEPYVYFADGNTVKNFNVYTGEEQPALSIPVGYTILHIDPPMFIALLDERTAKVVLMNVKTGQLSEPVNVQVDEQWPGALSYWGSGIRVDKTGEKLDLNIRGLFQTPDEFVVGHTRWEKTMTLNYIIHIDPRWMDAQLKQSRLYDLQRKELVSEEDYPSGPTPSIPWY